MSAISSSVTLTGGSGESIIEVIAEDQPNLQPYTKLPNRTAKIKLRMLLGQLTIGTFYT